MNKETEAVCFQSTLWFLELYFYFFNTMHSRIDFCTVSGRGIIYLSLLHYKYMVIHSLHYSGNEVGAFVICSKLRVSTSSGILNKTFIHSKKVK